jgi:hypothetical protein
MVPGTGGREWTLNKKWIQLYLKMIIDHDARTKSLPPYTPLQPYFNNSITSTIELARRLLVGQVKSKFHTFIDCFIYI